MNRRVIAGVFLGVLGVLQMSADLLGLDVVKGLAAATAASPAPKVFSAVGNLETYSVQFDLSWIDAGGARQSRRLDSALNEQLEGPYNRRNVYGAVLAYGPVLATNPRTAPMFESVLRRATCNGAPLLREIGVFDASAVQVLVTPLPGVDLGALPRVLEPRCE